MADSGKSVFLTGIMGSGKSTIGQLVAEKTNRTFIDADTVIEKWAGKSIPAIFAEDGEEHFRKLEQEVLRSLSSARSAIIALGGGALENGDTRVLLEEKGHMVWLRVNPGIAAARLSNATERPLLDDANSVQDKSRELREILQARKKNYEMAGCVIDTDSEEPAAIAKKIRDNFSISNAPVDNLWKIGQETESPYPVYIDYNVLGYIGDLCAGREYSGKAVIITDANVAELYHKQVSRSLENAGFEVVSEILKAGEEMKSLNVLEGLYIQLSEIGLDRRSPVIALGGGVIGDLAGFFAASFLRGVPLIHIPTSLLSQVDSSIGGKVGINLPTGKNLVGNFYNPDFVLADLNVLYSLPPREWNTGLGEVIKYGFIGKPQILELIAKDKSELVANLPKVVRECVAYKLEITTKDFTEGNIRRYLNFGHTLGHALEKVTDYKILNHGEAVYWGTIGALYLSVQSGHLPEETFFFGIDIMREMALKIPDFDLEPHVIHEALFFDKKRIRDTIHWVLLEGLGSPLIETNINDSMIYDAINFANDFVSKLSEEK